jgi:hypothetical protein
MGSSVATSRRLLKPPGVKPPRPNFFGRETSSRHSAYDDSMSKVAISSILSWHRTYVHSVQLVHSVHRIPGTVSEDKSTLKMF